MFTALALCMVLNGTPTPEPEYGPAGFRIILQPDFVQNVTFYFNGEELSKGTLVVIEDFENGDVVEITAKFTDSTGVEHEVVIELPLRIGRIRSFLIHIHDPTIDYNKVA